ncbi:MAG TPA: hypothetical protein VF175_06355 [Lacipirellula sp.]
MQNRLPKEFTAADPAGLRPAGAPYPAEFAGPKPPLRDRIVDAAANSVGSHPVASLGAAFVVGILLGKLVKR